MKIIRVTCCLFLLLLSLVAFTFTTSALRAHAASGTTFVSKIHGLAAVANFGGSDGCIDTIIEVHGFQPTQNKQPSNAFVFISKFDTCTNTSLLDASGSTNTATFQIDKKLISASLSAIVPLTDNQTGNPLFNVTVNMVWTTPPDSVIQHQNSTSHFHTKAFTVNSHFNADFRDATASGTLSDGTTNFTPSPSFFALVQAEGMTTVIITHP